MKCDKCDSTHSEHDVWIDCGDMGGKKGRFLCHKCYIEELDHLG